MTKNHCHIEDRNVGTENREDASAGAKSGGARVEAAVELCKGVQLMRRFERARSLVRGSMIEFVWGS